MRDMRDMRLMMDFRRPFDARMARPRAIAQGMGYFANAGLGVEIGNLLRSGSTVLAATIPAQRTSGFGYFGIAPSTSTGVPGSTFVPKEETLIETATKDEKGTYDAALTALNTANSNLFTARAALATATKNLELATAKFKSSPTATNKNTMVKAQTTQDNAQKLVAQREAEQVAAQKAFNAAKAALAAATKQATLDVFGGEVTLLDARNGGVVDVEGAPRGGGVVDGEVAPRGGGDGDGQIVLAKAGDLCADGKGVLFLQDGQLQCRVKTVSDTGNGDQADIDSPAEVELKKQLQEAALEKAKSDQRIADLDQRINDLMAKGDRDGALVADTEKKTEETKSQTADVKIQTALAKTPTQLLADKRKRTTKTVAVGGGIATLAYFLFFS